MKSRRSKISSASPKYLMKQSKVCRLDFAGITKEVAVMEFDKCRFSIKNAGLGMISPFYE